MKVPKSFKNRIYLTLNIFILVIFFVGILLAYNIQKTLIEDEIKSITNLNFTIIEKNLAESIIYDDIYTVFSILETISKNTGIYSNVYLLDRNQEYIADAKVLKKVPDFSDSQHFITYDINLSHSYIGKIIFEINKSYVKNKLSNLLINLIILHIIAFFIVSLILKWFINYLMRPFSELTNMLEYTYSLEEITNSINISKHDPKEIVKLKSVLKDVVNKLIEQLKLNIEQQKEIFRRDKIYSIGIMAAGLAHHLKNPIMTIKLLLSNLKSENLTKESINDINVIEQELDKMLSIINNFMLISKDKEIPLKNINTRDLFNQLRINFLPYKDLHIKIPENEIVFQSNFEKLLMIFENLIINSIQAKSKSIEINAQQTDHEVIFEISDDGTGIPYEYSDKIFIPFFSTKNKGTGLGLSYIQNLVQMLHGDIYLDNNYRNGAKFVLRFKYEKQDSYN